MSKPIRFGIISAGAISKNHIEGYTKAGGEVIAICDPVPAAVEGRQKEYKIAHGYPSVEELLANPDVDAVSVCSPNSMHCDFVLKALQAGKHVMTEKPMAMDVGQAKRMVEAAKKAGKILMCGHNQRFLPDCQKVDELRAAGALGEVYHARCGWIRRRGIPGLGRWFTTRSMSGGGPLIDIGIHLIDRTWYMMGKPRPVAVSGQTYNTFGKDIPGYVCTGMWAGPRDPQGTMDVEDFASAFIRFENGATMSVEVSWAGNRPDESPYSIIMGDKMGARVDDNGLTTFGERGDALSTETLAFDKAKYLDRHQHFLAAIRGDVPCSCPGEDGLMIQQVLNGIYESGTRNEEIRI